MRIDRLLRRSGFIAGPGVTASWYELTVWPEPGGARHSDGVSSWWLLDWADPANTDISLDLRYGNPYPASWGVMAAAAVSYKITENTPSLDNDLAGWAMVKGPIEMVWNGAVVPRMSPPRSVTIGGRPATSDLTDVSTTPVIA